MTSATVEIVQQMWMLTLVVYAVVVVAVAALLTAILLAARRVQTAVASIWTVGQQVANNTIHIALLDTTNHVAAEILDSAQRVAGATAAIGAHAGRCPGCPACVLG
jgi:hypothetical protein